MIQQRTSKPLFFIQCGDWETVTSAPTPFRACVQALKLAKQEYGGDMKTSNVIIAMNLQDQMEQKEDSISAFTLDNINLSTPNEY